MRKLNLSKSEANKSPQRTKSFIAMLVLALGLFLGMVEEGKAQNPCPNQDYQQATRVYTITYNGVTCSVTAELCIKCMPGTGPNDQSDIWVSDLHPFSCPGIPVAEIYRQIAQQIQNSGFMEYCGYGPCPSATVYRIVTPVCVRKYRYKVNYDYVYKVIPCGWSARCEKKYTICWNGTNGQVTPISNLVVGTPSCSLTEEQYQFDPNTDLTECWSIPCN